ncbi:guanine nucleotide-binding protein-like 1 [Liolophura sinensis]|uniref:guanine nucleotide-binding protein-like 1 n=1 Tax=Liolophura sinensis TaxID=3198878 RepID=UPI003157FFA8
MPRGKPFSTKQKKKQLQERRERKRQENGEHFGCQSSDDDADVESEAGPDIRVDKLNHQPELSLDPAYLDLNRYRLHFYQESNDEIHKRKELSRQPYQMVEETALEMDIECIYQTGSVLDMPKRPPWDYNQKKAQVEAREERFFKEYLKRIYDDYDLSDLSYFELNLETWRQLWRVLEMSDILLIITDIRYPALHFPPALYNYVTKELKKKVILTLNKIDLVPPAVVVAWKHYFHEHYPDLEIVCFTSFPRDFKDSHDAQSKRQEDPSRVVHKRRQLGRMAAVGQKELLETCEKITQGRVDLSGWQDKVRLMLEGVETGQDTVVMDGFTEEARDNPVPPGLYKDGVLTIGCVGYPNVGKSSLLNGLVGKKVVSVSKTPGHTKHFQTIFLTPTVKLCDCPGLVFPSLVQKPLQIVAGIYPIAQVREPYTAVGFIAERLNLPSLLHLTHPEANGGGSEEAGELKWSAFLICHAWAEKRGFMTAKAARPDVYRAANNILRMTLEGVLCLYFRPPGYTAKKDYWQSSPETDALSKLQEHHYCQRKVVETSDDQLASSEDEVEDSMEGMSPCDKSKAFIFKAHKREGHKSGGIAMRNVFELLSDD